LESAFDIETLYTFPNLIFDNTFSYEVSLIYILEYNSCLRNSINKMKINSFIYYKLIFISNR